MLNKVIIYQEASLVYTFAYTQDKLVFVVTDDLNLASEAIFLAKVSRLNQANCTAFIEYLPGKTGFINLPFTEKRRNFINSHACSDAAALPRLTMQEGSQIPVQLIWLGDNDKQAKFRYGWQLIGKYIVYLGNKPKPAKISNKKLAQLAKTNIDELLIKFPGQWVIRSSVASCEDINLLAAEMEEIYVEAQKLQKMFCCGKYYAGMPNYLKLLRSLPLADDCEVITNAAEIDQQLLSKQELWQIEAVSFDPDLSALDKVNNYKNLMAAKQVELKSGASLEIHTAAGINIIDVNSDKLSISGSKLNFLVLDAIYQQICLRNLQGIILLDLIKNMTKSEETKIIKYLEKLFCIDITNTKILGFSKLGLCEIIRNKF